MKNVLFVCLGNICRSAMAEGILRQELADRGLSDVNVDSAGTGSWHVGDPPDSRAIATTASNGIDISGQRARQVNNSDFENFDLIIAMDANNLSDLRSMAPAEHNEKLAKCLDFAAHSPGGDVPDPYYGGNDGFAPVMSMLGDACKGIADHISS